MLVNCIEKIQHTVNRAKLYATKYGVWYKWESCTGLTKAFMLYMGKEFNITQYLVIVYQKMINNNR